MTWKKQDIKKIEAAVEKAFDKGFDEVEIIEELIKEGWDVTTITEVIEDHKKNKK